PDPSRGRWRRAPPVYRDGQAAGPDGAVMASVTDPARAELSDQGAPGYEVPEPDRVTRFVQGTLARSPVWAAPAAVFLCMAGSVGYTLASHPTAAGADSVPTCLLKYTTGFDCPGCG